MFSGILLIASISSLFYKYQTFSIVKDFTYLLKPILGLLVGYQIFDKFKSKSFDVFINAQVRRTRLYLKVDNVTSGFTEKNYFSAPNYPYRDLTIRFGLVWNWFI